MGLFGKKQQYQIVELGDLGRFIENMIQHSGTTTINITIGKYHVHEAGSVGTYHAPQQLQRPEWPELQRPVSSTLLPPDTQASHPTPCPECWTLVEPGEGVSVEGAQYHERCAEHHAQDRYWNGR
jgi:hypothetical protein